MDTYSQIRKYARTSTLLSFRAAEIGKGLGAGLERVSEFSNARSKRNTKV